jgi:2-octaprenyl-6-methoxyphenol hydroxylase
MVTWDGSGGAETDVLIIGGGMVGMTLAAALAGAGVRVVVIDAQPARLRTAPAFDGRVSAIAAGSKAMLAAIGVWPRLEAEAEPILDIRVSDGHSPLFLHYDHRDLGDGPLGHMVENRHLRQALLAHLAGLESARLIDGRKVVSLDRDGARAAARLNDGRIVRAPLAVATDGSGSPTRRGAGIGITQWRYPQTGIVTTVAHARPHRGIAQEHFLPAGPFAILPMAGRRSSIVWTERTALAQRLVALDEAAFSAELALRFGDYLGKLRPVGPRFSYPLALLHADSYVAPRLALAGDAAHAMHPIAGQGLNMGLRDVAALAEVAVDGIRLGLDPGSPAVLEKYQRWRRFDNALMLAATDGLNRLFSNDVAPVRLARDLGLAAVNRMPPLKRLLMRQAMGLLGGDRPRLARGEAL